MTVQKNKVDRVNVECVAVSGAQVLLIIVFHLDTLCSIWRSWLNRIENRAHPDILMNEPEHHDQSDKFSWRKIVFIGATPSYSSTNQKTVICNLKIWTMIYEVSSDEIRPHPLWPWPRLSYSFNAIRVDHIHHSKGLKPTIATSSLSQSQPVQNFFFSFSILFHCHFLCIIWALNFPGCKRCAAINRHRISRAERRKEKSSITTADAAYT